jgi:hypothetical protein
VEQASIRAKIWAMQKSCETSQINVHNY